VIALSDEIKLQHRATPFAQVVEGLEVLEKLSSKYGERPKQMFDEISADDLLDERGSGWLDEHFPGLDRILRCDRVRRAAPTLQVTPQTHSRRIHVEDF